MVKFGVILCWLPPCDLRIQGLQGILAHGYQETVSIFILFVFSLENIIGITYDTSDTVRAPYSIHKIFVFVNLFWYCVIVKTLHKK